MGKTIRNLPFDVRRKLTAERESEHSEKSENERNRSLYWDKSVDSKLPKTTQRSGFTGYSGGYPTYAYYLNSRSDKIQPQKRYSGPCSCCLGLEGRMWMLKGLGKKSSLKTKGMRKHQDKLRDFI